MSGQYGLGARLGEIVGGFADVGTGVGDVVAADGDAVGIRVGTGDGLPVGSDDGKLVGKPDGATDGLPEGPYDGELEGVVDGLADGVNVMDVGFILGDADGGAEGPFVGVAVGADVGAVLSHVRVQAMLSSACAALLPS